MKHSDFLIGRDFQCGPRRWRCTDIGTRVIIAVMLDHNKDDQSWYNGPPYALLETVFDEYDLPGCCAYDNQPTLDTAMRLPEDSSINEKHSP